jgi:hypothetical protein
MLLFLDTEFTDFHDCSLISIGLVSEDGSFEYYGERTDFDYEACNSFVRSHVWANLGRFAHRRFKKAELEQNLALALANLPAPLSIAFDSDRDRQLMVGIFETCAVPRVSQYVDLRPMQSLVEYRRAEAAFFSAEQPQHHALFDAMANRAAWLACKGANYTEPSSGEAALEVAK